MAEEIVDSVNIIEEGLSKLPSVWDDKLNVIGLNTSILGSLQTTIDDIKEWANATSISNAAGYTLDDFGYLFNNLRNNRIDAEYRADLLSTMSSVTDSGTVSQVINLARSIAIKTSDTTFADITYYPNTRFGTLRLEGGILPEAMQKSINKAVSSGSRLLTSWDHLGTSFIPSVLVDVAAPEDILARLDAGTDPIGVRLGVGIIEALGYAADVVTVYYPSTKSRSFLKPSIGFSLGDSFGVLLELIGPYEETSISVVVPSALAVLSSSTTT